MQQNVVPFGFGMFDNVPDPSHDHEAAEQIRQPGDQQDNHDDYEAVEQVGRIGMQPSLTSSWLTSWVKAFFMGRPVCNHR